MGRPPNDPVKRAQWEAEAARRKVVKAKEREAELKRQIAEAETQAKVRELPVKPRGVQAVIPTSSSTFTPPKPPMATAARTPPALERGLSPTRLREIFSLCQQYNVRRFKSSELEFERNTDAEPKAIGAASGSQTPPVDPSSKAAFLSASDRQVMEELEQTQQLIDDPVAFEDSVIDEHLRQGTTGAQSPEDRPAQQDLRGG